MAGSGVVTLSYVVNSSSFNKSMSDMKKNLQLMQIEAKNAAREVDLYGNNITNLAKKQSAIQSAIKQTEKIMESYNNQLEKNKTSLEKNQTELTKLAAKKKELTSEYKNAVKVYGEESQEALRLKTSLEQVNKEYDQTKGKLASNKSNIQNYTTQIERTRGTLLDLENQLKQTNEEIERQSDKFVSASENFAGYSKKLEAAGKTLNDIGDAALTAGGAIVTAATGLATMAIETDAQLSTISGRLGLTVEQSEELKEAALRLYENGFGESLPDCIDDVVMLQQVLGDTTNVTGEERDKLLEYIETIKSLFGADTQELLRTANNMVKTGLVGSFEEAMNVITVGYQENLNYQGDFLDTLNEYSSQYTQLGFDALDVIAMLNEGVEAGAFNTDKLADSVKEFGLRVREGSDDTRNAFNEMGLDAEDMLNKFSQGGDAAKNAFYDTLDAISRIEDPIQRNKIGIALMGTQWEDVGEKAILAMADARNATIDVTDATAKAGEEINNNMSTKIETVMRRLKDSLAGLGKSLLPVVEEVADGIEDLTKFISKLDPALVRSIAKFGAMALAFGAVTKATGSLVTGLSKGASGLSKFLKLMSDAKTMGSFAKALGNTSTVASGLISTVGKLGGALVSLGPAGIAGIAIAGVAGIAAAWNKFQDGLSESTEEFKTAADNLESFDGRVRTSDSLLSKVFGKKIKIEFSAEFEQAREEVKQGYDDLNAALKQYYEDKWQIDHDGCEDEAEHQKHREENERKHKEELFKIQYGERKDLNEGKDKSMQNVTDYLVNDLGMSGLGAGDTQANIASWMNDKIKIVEEGEQRIYEIEKNAYSQNRELTASEQQEINKITEETGKWRALFETGNAEDIFNAWEAEYINEKTVLDESQKRREKYTNDIKESMWEANKSVCSNIDEQIKKIQEMEGVDEDVKAKEIERLQGQKAAVSDFTEHFGNNMETNIKNGESFEAATARSFEQICNDLESGKINAQEFGMTNEEYMAKAIDAMIEGGASADDLTYAIAQIPKDKRADVLAKVQGKDESEELKKAIDGLNDKTIYIRTYYETHGLSNVNYHYENGVAVPNRETGGSVNESGVYNTQEAGLELIDTASPSATAYSLGSATRGELTYIPSNSKVTNAAMTTLKMQSMINEQLQSSVKLYMAGLKKELVSALKENGGNGDFNVTMNNPHFENKGSEAANVSNVRRIVNSMK